MACEDEQAAAGPALTRSEIEACIDRARAGSNSALGSLLEGCRTYLLLVANRELDSDLRPKASASDLVQDSFVEAHHDFAKFEGKSREELLAWLTAILTNRLYNHARRYRHTQKRSVGRELPFDMAPHEALPNFTQDLTPSKAAALHDEQHRLQVAMAQLPEHLREVLVLRTWERMSFEQVGETMGRSAEAARKLWIRAVRQLQRELGTH